MNLAEALVTVPELPKITVSKRKLKLNPALVVREEVDENHNPVAVVYVPEEGCVYRIPQGQFELLKLFDGERTYVEIAEAYQEMGGSWTEQQVREFAGSAQDTGLWYVSPQEKNITLSQKLAEERNKRVKRKSKHGDLAHMVFKFWDPDDFLEKADRKLGFLFTKWFTALTLVLFAVMAYLWVLNWTQIGRDTLRYYAVTGKSGWDILEFWILFTIMAFLHETAHGLTCKHYGGHVHNIGFQLIYLTPAFAADITEVWVRTGKWQRIAAIMAGIWVETIVCAIATVIWWGTPLGSPVHELAYKFMLITGVMVVVMNLNPLIKLDGYYALGELTGIQELKEKSTAFLSGWVKKHVWGLPVEYDYVPPRRRLGYVVYAVLSGIYSYLLLFAVSRILYNFLKNYSPEWAFLPAAFLTWKIFKSRIKKLLAFMKTVYLDKREKLAMTPAKWAVVAGASVVLFLVPVFRQTANALFVLEPIERAEIRAQVPGLVDRVMVDETSRVHSGATLVQLSNPDLASQAAQADAALAIARAERTQAQLVYASLGQSQAELARAATVSQTLHERVGHLNVRSPIEGIVMTPRVHNLAGTYVSEGTLLMDVENTSVLRARLYLPEYEVRDIRPRAMVALRTNAAAGTVKGVVDTIANAPTHVAEGLIPPPQYQGLKSENYYVVNVSVPNAGELRSGMSGEAKIFIRRRSLGRVIWQETADFISRRVW